MLQPPLQPMLLKTAEEPFNSKDYLFEFKWDGFRTIIFINKKKVYLQSRNGKNLTPYFSELKQLSSYINKSSLVLDGEICYFNSDNKSRFNILQKRLSSRDKNLTLQYPVTYITWDILSTGETYIYNKKLSERKKILDNSITEENNFLQISPWILEKGEKLYNKAENNDFEGIVAKQLDSKYEFRRSDKWKKIKIWKYENVYIGGFTREKTALLVGIKNKQEQLNYMGKVKTALTPREREALFNFLPELKTEKTPFSNPGQMEDITWVKPHISCRVKYNELTPDNNFRHGYITELNL
ncbi:MAG: non-homologous end-joining DNA ligase [Halanaerobiaceae bacterium]